MTHNIIMAHGPANRLVGSAGDDIIEGGGFIRNFINGGAGNDVINPGIFNPLEGMQFDLKIYGDRHNDRSFESIGDDIIAGGPGIRAIGGAGRDTYIQHGDDDGVFLMPAFNTGWAPGGGTRVGQDTFIMAADRGVTVVEDDFRFFLTEKANGKTEINVTKIGLLGSSANPIVDGQHAVLLSDPGRTNRGAEGIFDPVNDDGIMFAMTIREGDTRDPLEIVQARFDRHVEGNGWEHSELDWFNPTASDDFFF